MNEIELKKFYDNISVENDVGDYDTFKSKMLTKENRKKFYDKISVENDVGDYDDFEKRLSTPQQSNANSGGGSSTPRTRGTILNPQDYEGINFKYKYPGDKNYRYGVKANEWYAKNITNNRVFNISKDGFTSSVNYLNAQFPNAFKEVVQPITPETKTPETPTQDSTKVVTNVPPIKPVDSANTGTPVKPVDSVNTITPIKPVDSTTDEPDDLTNY
jgi:hypothetical protein